MKKPPERAAVGRTCSLWGCGGRVPPSREREMANPDDIIHWPKYTPTVWPVHRPMRLLYPPEPQKPNTIAYRMARVLEDIRERAMRYLFAITLVALAGAFYVNL